MGFIAISLLFDDEIVYGIDIDDEQAPPKIGDVLTQCCLLLFGHGPEIQQGSDVGS